MNPPGKWRAWAMRQRCDYNELVVRRLSEKAFAAKGTNESRPAFCFGEGEVIVDLSAGGAATVSGEADAAIFEDGCIWDECITFGAGCIAHGSPFVGLYTP